jgi:hypothetical protein
MLYHVTATHGADNCPAYNPEQMGNFLALADQLEPFAAEIGLKVHYLLWAAPDHVAYALVETDNFGTIGRFLNRIPIRQEFRITPVQHLKDVVEMGKAMMAQQQGKG